MIITGLSERTMCSTLHLKRSVVVLTTMLLTTAAVMVLAGCSEEASRFAGAQGKATPYILKEDCNFTIVEELSRAGVTSPKSTGMAEVTASASISLGAKSITVSDCAVTRNSHSLPIYEG